MVQFTLKQCAYFTAVARHGGISQAARELSISQPSVSAAIDKLEAITGLTLFERHHARGLQLTMQGCLFLEHVDGLNALADQVNMEAKALSLEMAGEVRLGVFWTMAPFYLPKLISGFQEHMPKVVIRPSEMSLAELTTALQAGEIDLALTYDLGHALPGIEMRQMTEITLRAFVAEDHPLARANDVSVLDLQDEPYVMLDGPGSRAFFEDVFREFGVVPNVAFSSASMETVRSAVAAGLGFTLLAMQPPSLRCYDGGRLAPLELSPAPSPVRVALASKTDRHNSKLLRAFSDHAAVFFESVWDV